MITEKLKRKWLKRKQKKDRRRAKEEKKFTSASNEKKPDLKSLFANVKRNC